MTNQIRVLSDSDIQSLVDLQQVINCVEPGLGPVEPVEVSRAA